MASYNATAVAATPSEDKLWLLACSEIWSDGYKYDSSKPNGYGYTRLKEGEQYQYYINATNGITYNSANTKLVKSTLNGTADYWWLRSPYYYFNSVFCNVDSSGFADHTSAISGGRVAFGFSI